MVLIDFTQTIIAGLMAQLKMNDGQVSEDMLRHMILNSVRNYQKKYAPDYGEIVLCTDSSHTWRKEFYPLYKANRKKSRSESDIDWNELFTVVHKIRDEIDESFPYKVVNVDRVEADDIIGTICHDNGEVLNTGGEKFLILSGSRIAV